MLHPLPLPLSSCLGCIPPLIGLPSLRFYAVGSSLFLLSVCFCLCSLFYRDDVLCWLLLARPFLYAFHAHLRFPVDLVWFRLSCDHGWIRSGSVNVRKQQQQQQLSYTHIIHVADPRFSDCCTTAVQRSPRAPNPDARSRGARDNAVRLREVESARVPPRHAVPGSTMGS